MSIIKRAVALLRPDVQRGSHRPEVYRTLGVAHYRLGDYRSSQVALQQALSSTGERGGAGWWVRLGIGPYDRSLPQDLHGHIEAPNVGEGRSDLFLGGGVICFFTLDFIINAS